MMDYEIIVSAYAIWRFWWCQKIKSYSNVDSSQDQEIKRNDLQIVLYMLKKSLKEVAKVWP